MFHQVINESLDTIRRVLWDVFAVIPAQIGQDVWDCMFPVKSLPDEYAHRIEAIALASVRIEK